MIYFYENFAKLLDAYPARELSSKPGSVYGIDAEFRLACANPAWFTFARDNNGEPEISSSWGGRSILEAMPPVVRDFYEQNYRTCLATGKKWQHEYECSSPERYRRFHQVAYPLTGGKGLLLVNAQVIEVPHSKDRVRPENTELAHYLDPNGFICQCAHCRRVKNFSVTTPQRWDWIPEWVNRCPPNTSHSFCPSCYGHYYGSRAPHKPATRPPQRSSD